MVCMIRAVSFLHMLGLNSASLKGETNSAAQKENIAITVCCLYPIIVAGSRSVCALMCAMPQTWESQGNNWWDRKEPDLCILATEMELIYLFLYTFSHMKILASSASVFC